MTGLRIESDRKHSTVIVSLEGEFDLAEADNVDQELRRQEADSPGTIAMDLRNLSFIDSSGLRTLIMARRRAAEAQRRLVLVGCADEVRRVFELTGTEKLFEMVDDLDQV